MLYRRTISARPAAGCGLSSSRGPPGRGRLVTRYQVALAGRAAGSAVATTRRRAPSGPDQPAAEPVLVAVGAVRHYRAEHEPRRPGPDRQVRADGQLGAERRIVL